MVQSAHNDDLPLFKLNSTHIRSIQYISRWNNILIENHLRHFITSISKVKGFESFYNLQRNNIYRIEEVDWDATFYALNDDEATSLTSLEFSAKKAMKVKFPLGELSPIYQLRKRCFDLYGDWKCSDCGNEKENFDHIWQCLTHRKYMAHIVLNAKKYLLYQMICLKSDSCTFSDLDFDTFLWSYTNHGHYLSFIDILKGFIPLSLSNFITSHT